MKINKFNEKTTFNIVNSADMENWSSEKPMVYSGKKNINYNVGNKVIELLTKYGLGITGVGPGEWLKKSNLLLADEINIKEYRVNIGKKQDWDDFIEDYENENDVEYDKLSEEEQEKIDDIYANLPYDDVPRHGREEIEFSVFLPNNVKNINSAAMSDASTYLKLLIDSGFELYSRDLDDSAVFHHEPISTKNFINGKKITINNNNLEDIVPISYRLYKDGKVFDAFREFLGDSESKAKEFFNEWLKLIK